MTKTTVYGYSTSRINSISNRKEPSCDMYTRKQFYFIAGLTIAIIFMCVVYIITQSTIKLQTSASENVNIDVKTPAILVELNQKNNYFCLSSSEYGQPYLPEEFQCHQCSISDETSNKLKKSWNEDHILLISRIDNKIIASEIDVSSISGYKINTWYKNISYYPEKAQGMSQCASGTKALATCYQTTNGCIFMFQKPLQQDDKK